VNAGQEWGHGNVSVGGPDLIFVQSMLQRNTGRALTAMAVFMAGKPMAVFLKHAGKSKFSEAGKRWKIFARMRWLMAAGGIFTGLNFVVPANAGTQCLLIGLLKALDYSLRSPFGLPLGHSAQALSRVRGDDGEAAGAVKKVIQPAVPCYFCAAAIAAGDVLR
jgi:hypothetical protein